MENENKIYSPEELNEAEELLLTLCRIRSVSGFEGNAKASAALEKIAALCGGFSGITHAPGGNHIFRRPASGGGKKGEKAPCFLLDAHFDEIGMMVQSISDEGLITLTPLGGMDPRTLSAGRFALLAEEEIPAVCCSPAVTCPGTDAKKTPEWKDLPFFTGFTKVQLAGKGVKIGTPVGFAGEPVSFGSGMVSFHSFDNKAGAAAIFLAAKYLAATPLSCELCLLLSSGEESHMTGAKTGTTVLCPTEAIVVDTDFAVTPDVDGKKGVECGGGPSVTLSVQTDRRMTKRILALGEEKKIPCKQLLWPDSTGTNAIAVPFLAGGVRTAVVSVPIKYMHTGRETLLPEDIVSAAKLLAAYITERYGISPKKGEKK